MTTPADAVEILNRVHEADPTVLPALINYRVPCNLAVADDPTVQVGRVEPQTMEDPPDAWEVGFLGIINGLFGINPNGRPGYGYIAAVNDEAGNLLRFEVLG